METILLTGGAGFIGSHLAETLIRMGIFRIICIDNFDDFYPRTIKEQNLKDLLEHPGFKMIEDDIGRLSVKRLEEICADTSVRCIIHLAAKAGVRNSLADPKSYYRTNVGGTLNLLEFAKHAGIPRFIFASSSSVYGDNPKLPWSESEQDLYPISPYASSKLAAEQLGQVYAHLYDIHFTALRLFTVYGPRQRPDLAIHKFYNLMKHDKEIRLYGNGSTKRDYTYVDDIVGAVIDAMRFNGQKNFNVFNIGRGNPVSLLEMVNTLEEVLGKKAKIRFTEEQPGDVRQTWADITLSEEYLHYTPVISLKEGIGKFLSWKEKKSQLSYY